MTLFIPETTKYPAEEQRFISRRLAARCNKDGDKTWEEFYLRFAAAVQDGDLMTVQEYQEKYGEAIKRDLGLT